MHKHTIETNYNDKHAEIQMINLYLSKADCRIVAIYTRHASIDEITALVKKWGRPIPIISHHTRFIMRFFQ